MGFFLFRMIATEHPDQRLIRWLVDVLAVALLVLAPTTTDAQESSGHPRLFFTADDIESLREQAATTHADIWLSIQAYANSQLAATPPTSAPVGESTEATINNINQAGDQLIAFAFACVITNQPEYCDLTKNHLLAYAQWPAWDVGELRDLSLAHMLVGNSLAYDWIYGYLTDDERQVVAQAIAAHAQEMYEASVGPYNDAWNNWWSGSYIQNHFSTNTSAFGLAALALAGDGDFDTQAWLLQASTEVSKLTYLLNQMQDGTWHESIDYQTGMFAVLLPFLVNLRALEEIDLIPHEYMQNYAYWRLYNHLPGTTEDVLGFGDFETWWGNVGAAENLLRFIAREYRNRHAEWLAQQFVPPGSRTPSILGVFEFLYYDPSVEPQSPDDLPTGRAFPDLGAAILRTGWGDNDLVFGLKGANYGGAFALTTFANRLYPWNSCETVACTFNVSHDHADANTFYLYQGRQRLASEWIGWGVRDTTSHNTITIDGQNQFLPMTEHFGSPESFLGTRGRLTLSTTPTFGYVASDATGLYPTIPDLRDFTRHVVFVKPDYLLMLDNLAADSPHTYHWFGHVGDEISLEGNWVRANAGDNQVLGIGIVSPDPVDAVVSADALPYVRLGSMGQADARFINLFFPTDTEGWNQRPQATLVEDTGAIAFVRVDLPDGRIDEILVNYGSGAQPGVTRAYSTDARVVVMQRDAEGLLTRVYVFGGTFLSDNELGHMLVNNLSPDVSFEAEFQGDSITVSADLHAPITIYGPTYTAVTVNGETVAFARQEDYLTFGE